VGQLAPDARPVWALGRDGTMTGKGEWLTPPDGWRDRDDAGRFKRAVSELAFYEAQVLRARERLKVDAPTDSDWEVLLDWEAAAYEHLAVIASVEELRDMAAREVEAILIRWHDEDRGKG
jgi:hypothetical protein